MKKILMTIMAMTMLVATSCKKENINEPNNIVPGEGEFVVTIANAPRQNAPALSDDMTTKTTIHGSDIHWKAFDEISINGVKYQTDMSGSPTVLFKSNEGSAPQIDGYYKAYYPAGIDPTNNGGISTLPDAVLYDGGDLKNLSMYAVSTNEYLTFNNICAALKITVPVDCDQIVISANENLAGKFSIGYDATTSAPMAVLSTDEVFAELMSKEITVNGTFTANAPVYVAIPAGTYTNFAVEFLNGQDSIMRRILPNDLNLKVNNLYNLTFGEIPADAFCFTAKSKCSVRLIKVQSAPQCTLEYCTIPGGSWRIYNGTPVALRNSGDKVCFRASENGVTKFASSTSDYYKFSVSSGLVSVSGNIMYLLDRTGVKNNLTEDYTFCCLFKDLTALVDASGLILPAETLTNNCYYGMFQGCTGLKSAPNLHATTLANNCYYNMFNGCSLLGVSTTDQGGTSLRVPSNAGDVSIWGIGMFNGTVGGITPSAGQTYYFYDPSQTQN